MKNDSLVLWRGDWQGALGCRFGVKWSDPAESGFTPWFSVAPKYVEAIAAAIPDLELRGTPATTVAPVKATFSIHLREDVATSGRNYYLQADHEDHSAVRLTYLDREMAETLGAYEAVAYHRLDDEAYDVIVKRAKVAELRQQAAKLEQSLPPVETAERHSDIARNLVINKACSDIEDIVLTHDPDTDAPIDHGIWDRLDRMAMDIEARHHSQEPAESLPAPGM